MKIILNHKNLHLRPMSVKDLKFFVNLRNQSVQYLHDNRKFNLKDAKQWFPKTNNQYFIIEKDNQMVGYLRTSDWNLVNKNVAIGCDILPKFRRQGIATKAYHLFMDHIFNQMNFHKVWLEVLETNQPAINLYQKLGFKEEGRRKQHLKRESKFIDSIIMSLLKEDFKVN